MPALTVCVYCSASEDVDGKYRAVAAELGRAIAEAGWGLVYGGGNIGLMGEVARAALAAGGSVTGVIPHRLVDREVAMPELDELICVDTLRERKAIMDDRADAFIVLPGGLGTLEELAEIVTLKQLGYHERAIVVCDAFGFWDPLLAQVNRMVTQGFAAATALELFAVTPDVPATLAAVCAAQTEGQPPRAVRLEATPAPPKSP